MNCPKDESLLIKSESVPSSYQCKACSGILVHSFDISKMISQTGIDAFKINPFRVSQITCPQCLNKMDCRVLNEVEIEICKSCSLSWFDHGELERYRQPMNPVEKEKLMEISSTMDDFGILQALLRFR